MPQPLKIDDDDHETSPAPRPVTPMTFSGFAEQAFGYVEKAAGEYMDLVSGFTASFTQGLLGAVVPPPKTEDRVGKYYADYSPLTPEEIAQVDPEAEALYRRSKPVSR